MEILNEYILFKIAKGIGSDYKSLFNFILTQRYLANYLRIYESAVEELKKQILIKVERIIEENKTIHHILPNQKKCGEYKEWCKNGQLFKECFYKDGELEGEYKEWNCGKLYRREFYKDGKLEGEYKSWFQNGQLSSLSFYTKGKLEGECKIWYRTGNLVRRSFYKNGKLDGERKEWWSNGYLRKQTFYKEGELEGKCTKWNRNGIFTKNYFTGKNKYDS